MSKTIEDLRSRLFDVMDGIKAGTVTLEQAQTILSVGQVIVNTAKVEVDYLRATEGGESSFIGTAVGQRNLPSGILSITRHRMEG